MTIACFPLARWSCSSRAASTVLKRGTKCTARTSPSFMTSVHRRSSNRGADNDGVCLVSERHKFQSNEELAAFAFARLASPGHTSIGPSEFISVLKRMQLDFNLGDCELRRVFDSLDANGDGRLSLEEFKLGGGSHPLTQALVQTLGSSGASATADHFPDPDFDVRASTAEFYNAPLESGFVGDNVEIRKVLDHCYHRNYTKQRQNFQDALIKGNVLLEGSGSDRPWYVLTCGPMGAGKGWVLGWMSANGILQLERVSKIDPDAFKPRMPEWQLYQEQGMMGVAGTRTHAESSYIAEIAQHVAMNNNMDVWVDGSLRDWKWYERELQRIRTQYPQYRIAIISISAPEELIESNIKKRALETGRAIPDELRRATSIDEIGKGIVKLVYLVDMIASVQNTPADTESDNNKVSEPVLKSVSMVDRSGNWDLIRELASSQ